MQAKVAAQRQRSTPGPAQALPAGKAGRLASSVLGLFWRGEQAEPRARPAMKLFWGSFFRPRFCAHGRQQEQKRKQSARARLTPGRSHRVLIVHLVIKFGVRSPKDRVQFVIVRRTSGPMRSLSISRERSSLLLFQEAACHCFSFHTSRSKINEMMISTSLFPCSPKCRHQPPST